MPDALSAEDWFRFHGRHANAERIEVVPLNPTPVFNSMCVTRPAQPTNYRLLPQ